MDSTLIFLAWLSLCIEIEVYGLSRDPSTKAIWCFCSGYCPEHHVNFTCRAQPGSSCFAAVTEELRSDGVVELVKTYGCLGKEGHTIFQCHGDLVPHSQPTSILCCNDEDMCNERLEPNITYRASTTVPASYMDDPAHVAVFVSVCAVIALLLGITLGLYCSYRHREQRRRRMWDSDSVMRRPFLPSTSSNGESLKDLIEQSHSTGSGSGVPLLVQRTIAKQIQLKDCLRKGHYSEVWKAKWRGEHVACKIFFTRNEEKWNRETEIYQTVLLRHENILGFIAADIQGSGSGLKMYLITDYHQNGSLYDYLQVRQFDTVQMVKLAVTAASGIAHLHTEIHGIQGKPAIAHRDIKSKNILVKNNGACVIADLGLSVKYNSATNEVDMPKDSRIGTRRYMAPEMLDGKINASSFEEIKLSDIYSFGLVLWEITLRCSCDGEAADPYQMPYEGLVPVDPSFEEMKRTVVDEKCRPAAPARWGRSAEQQAMRQLMTECWHESPASRLTALRVKKSLQRLQCDLDHKSDIKIPL